MPALTLVTGSREYADLEAVRLWASTLTGCLMEGGAKGVDTAAAEGFLRTRPLGDLWVRPADWRGKGKVAGIFRNRAMVDECVEVRDLGRAVEVHAWWDGQSSGTRHCCEYALSAGFAIHLHTIDKPTEIWSCCSEL